MTFSTSSIILTPILVLLLLTTSSFDFVGGKFFSSHYFLPPFDPFIHSKKWKPQRIAQSNCGCFFLRLIFLLASSFAPRCKRDLVRNRPCCVHAVTLTDRPAFKPFLAKYEEREDMVFCPYLSSSFRDDIPAENETRFFISFLLSFQHSVCLYTYME